ncbi:MAG: secretion system protein E [Planctomycetaceae bacterium]|nr:secretion system protein E [Planctomycetaceae bacterium]
MAQVPDTTPGSAPPDNAAADPSAASPGQAPAPAAVPAAPAAGRYPPSPNPFFRGNGPGNAGFYFNLFGLILILLAFMFLSWTSYWVNDDSTALQVRSDYWNSMIFGCGIISVLAVLTVPSFMIGFIVMGVLQGVPLGLYVRERNSMVPDSAKVMTKHHIHGWLIRKLALIGINLGGGKVVQAAVGPDLQFIGKQETSGRGDGGRSKQVEASRGYMAAKELVYDALLRRCTDIHLEPKDDELAVRMRIDGVMYPVEPFDRSLGDAVINIFKVLGAMDITEKRKSLDGSFRALCEGREIDFRVATQGTRTGEKMSLRILDQSNSVSTVKDLGFRKQLQESLMEVISQPHGLMLVCGPTGAGKSTTLYASLNALNPFEQNIITIEDPVEYKIGDVTQIEINQKAGQTFGNSLRSVLRQDPDVVMLGEIRDGETANIACQAANTGHMVFSTVHANDSITALYRMIDLGVEPFMLSSSLSAILAQRLARRLCNSCREAYKPKPEFLKKANLPAQKINKFYRVPKDPEETCPSCGGLGYRGRIGVYEFLEMNDRMRDMIREAAGISAIKSEARKNGMLYMKEEGLRLVVRGVTSIDELLRVVK